MTALTLGPWLRVPAVVSIGWWRWAISHNSLEREVLLNVLVEPGIFAFLSSSALSLRLMVAAWVCQQG